jgi:hypothetical protein
MRRTLLATTTALALVSTSPAFALTPDDVWAAWSPWLEAEGYTPTSTMSEGGGIVVLGLTKTDETGVFLAPTMRLMPDGDSVVVSLPDPITFTGADSARMALDASQMELRLDDAANPGALGAVAGVLTGDLALELSDTSGDEAMSGSFALQGVSIEAPEGDGNDGAEVTTAFQSMRFTFDLPAPEGRMQVAGENGAFEGVFAVEGLEALAGADPVAAISQGTNLRAVGTHGAGTYTIVHPTEGANQSWSDGAFEASLDRSGVAYDTAMNGVAMDGALPDGMGTFAATASQMAFGVAMPLFAQGEEQPARMDLTIADLVVDAAGTNLPPEMKAMFAEPMGVVLAVTAQVDLFRDLFPVSMAADPENPETAGRVTSATLEKLDVSFAGSTAQATGETMVDGSNFADSKPGQAKGNVTLGNVVSAMDVLEGAGVIDESVRGMAEGMLRGFAKPGETDTLTYDLETDDWVGFSVNGTRF